MTVHTYYVIIGPDGSPEFCELNKPGIGGYQLERSRVAWEGFQIAEDEDTAVVRAHESAVRKLFGEL